MLPGCRIEAKMPEFCTFAPMSKKKQNMTQKAAIVKALEECGGRARLSNIYPRVIELATFKEDSDKQATIRTTMQRHPELFRHSPGRFDGWWELVSYQEDIACRDNRIAELEALLAAWDKEISELKQQETAELFVARMIKATKTVFATKRNDARPVQQVLVVMNRPEQQELMEWIIGKPMKVVSKTITKKIIQKTINSNTYVDHQTVIPSVGNYKPQITTQNIEASMPSIEQQQEQKQL
jgi:hypothetical protein